MGDGVQADPVSHSYKRPEQETKDVVTALKAYEAERLWVTAQIVQDNRFGGQSV